MPRVKLQDGRNISYFEYGDPDGSPVIFIHGFGDSGVLRHYDDAFTNSFGLRIIAPHMPGVERSTRAKGRKIADFGRDVEQLADRLKLENFAVAGHSAGGPHALAVAAHLGERVTAASLIAPAGIFSEKGISMLIRSVELRYLAKLYRGHHLLLLRLAMRSGALMTRLSARTAFFNLMKSCPKDAGLLSRPRDQREIVFKSLTQGMAQGGAGANDTLLAVLGDWGFDLKDVKVPTTIFLPEQDDLLKPEIVVDLASKIENSTLVRWADAGHFSLLSPEHWEDVLVSLGGFGQTEQD